MENTKSGGFGNETDYSSIVSEWNSSGNCQKCTYMDMATKIPYSSNGIHIDNMNENVQFTY